jgi:hypothetical protein
MAIPDALALYYPDDPRDPDPLDDRHVWPGPVEAEFPPADLVECDICGDLRDCLCIERPGCNLYACDDCVRDHLEELEGLRAAA